MPQKLTDKWQKELGKDNEVVKEKYLHNIGNLTLTGYNSEFSNKSFNEKKKIMNEKKSHIVVLNKDIFNQEH